jgi:exodeoxyribonuclease VII large subunit
MQTISPPRIFTVSEITKSIKGILETSFSFVTITGEISNLRQPYSGHLYFILKDDAAQLRGILFKQQQRYLDALPVEGQQVICRGRLSVYEPRGEYQLIVDYLQISGKGPLYLIFEQLKKKLAAEGLFDTAHKKNLPLLPARIALVTSPDGAALFDFLKVALFRHPGQALEILPVRVQGDEAAGDIITAVQTINERQSSEVIVICRGGGSQEDLWPFNNENLARTIYHSDIPVVTAIGHEIDFTIADLVSDHRSPTPSAAAEEIVPDAARLQERIDTRLHRLVVRTGSTISELGGRLRMQRRILGDPRSRLVHHLLYLDHARSSLLHGLVNSLRIRESRLDRLSAHLRERNPAAKVARLQQRLNEAARQLETTTVMRLSALEASLTRVVAVLDAVNPYQVLDRGYSIVRTRPAGAVITSSRQTSVGQCLEILLAHGSVGCEVTDIQEEQEGTTSREHGAGLPPR